jgi:HK97 gp10 family phage protein
MIKIDLKGFDTTISNINKIAKDTEFKVKEALVDFGTKVETQAKRDAPADEGKLRNSINATYPKNGLSVEVTVAADYAAYMEFGTRKFAAQYVATLPQDWQAYAATFKGGGGGTFDQFVLAMMEWVKRKGLRLDNNKMYEQSDSFTLTGKLRKDKKIGGRKKKTILEGQQQLAYIIAKKIMIEGVRPQGKNGQGYLYPAVKKYTPELITDIKNIFK